jgi:hypothetical protein
MTESESEPKGCLTAILSLFGFNLGGSSGIIDEFPYRQRDDFLSAAELSFFRVLIASIDNRAVICPKVNLGDIFFVIRPKENWRYRNKIDRKHVDFLICDLTMKPRCGVELDDSSHSRNDRQKRDEFVDQVFHVAGLPLIRVPARSAYNPTELFALIEPHLSHEAVQRVVQPASSETGSPICPKCGVEMVRRVAKKGPNAGQSFFGCPNFPKCTEKA